MLIKIVNQIRFILEFQQEELKREFTKKLPPKDESAIHCDAIIRDLKRMDSLFFCNVRKKSITQ